MFCTQCRAELPEGSRFCNQCGSAVIKSKRRSARGIIITVVIAIPVLLWISSTHDESPQQAPVVDRNTVQGAYSNSTAPAVSTPTPAPRNLPPTYPMGQQFSIGYWSYICHRAFWTPVIGSSPYTMERANGKFVVIEITAQNNDTSASTLPPFQLGDDQGRMHDESTVAMGTQGFFSVLDQLNPGVSKRAFIAFDVPPEQRYALVVSGGIESGKKALVVLPMSTLNNEPAGDTKAPATE